ncbi:hypothetical protein GQ55_6G250300 [Panicum hallii var. hallii]|uniref:Protein kinase domain-containing protein n=1 Tax=Panicum hallii var. hallii TaxID=1504633 RepID=A0A2T7D9F3_9POAL|nr:hypothetical protein GQ55_6G250300 [Panicum hallii var. hallii]
MEFSRPPHGLRLLVTAWLLAGVAAARSPRCPNVTWCGNVEVPYPYGLDKECAIHEDFHLSCTPVDGVSKLFHGKMEVTKISVQDDKAWLKTWISRQCYDQSREGMIYNDAWMNLTGTVYVLSANDNRIIVLGCRGLAYMLSDSYAIGCVSTCDDGVPLKNGSCSGTDGCCHVDLPKGVRYYQGYFNPLYNTTQIWRTTPCNYVSVMESAAFRFSTTYLTSTAFYDKDHAKIPAVMEWAITRNTTCEEARINTTSYACVSDHSHCIMNDAGYACNCSSGYKGNPYIVDGCKDIDECLDNITYPCPGICKNTPGSFTCSCPRGGRMIRDVCTKDPKFIWTAPVVGTSIGLVLLVVAIACACSIQDRRNLHRIKQKYFRQHGGLLLFQEMKSQQGEATNRFAEQQVIGHGGHGKVYKGVLKGNVEVAVKRCMTIDQQHKKEFGKEMLILSQINHRNIVKLLGYCLEVEVPMLVYEFIPNGTLFQLIHGNHSGHISLDTRVRIPHESAEALDYLHSSASPPIVHGDVKSANILLNGDFTAKVSDFGASILAPSDESQFVTLVQGTCGYLDPEYMQTCQLTDKSDIYSFGVVLLELLTRKKPFNLKGPEQEKSLSMVFLEAMKENKLEDILDDEIKNDENLEFLEEIAELARQCLEMCGVNRPSMKEVADKLGRLRKVLQHPWAHKDPEELDSLLGESSSVNSGTILSSGNFSITKKVAMGLESGR